MSQQETDEEGTEAMAGRPGAAPAESLPDAAFRTIVETFSLPILVVAGDGTIRYASGSVERHFGWRPDQLVGRNIIEFTPPEQVDQARQSVADLVMHDELGIGVPTVFAVIRGDGELTWTAVAAVPLLEPPVDGITFYFLPWDAQLHFDDFFDSLLADEPLDVVLTRLGLSIAISMEAGGAVVHHGFDGVSFAGASGAGLPEECRGLADSPWHRAARTGDPQYVRSRDLGHAAEAVAAAGIRGCWAIPLPPHEGLAPAVLSVWRWSETEPVTAHDFVISRSLRYAQLALVRSAEHRQLAYLADHDHLTGVANRARFGRLVDEALAHEPQDVTLLYCDLDGFKAVNDTRGHGVGDAVLVEVAARLEQALDGAGELARIGGDEFTVLVRTDVAGALDLGQRLLLAMDEPFTVAGESVRLDVSVGIAVGGSGDTADSLLNRADTALYRAKRGGGHQVCVDEPRDGVATSSDAGEA